MANARTRYDAIRDYLVRTHEVTAGLSFSRPCVQLGSKAFMVFLGEHMAFKLRGRSRLQAMALQGAKFWDPYGRDAPAFDWIEVPNQHFLRWDRLAFEALRCAKEESGGLRPTAGGEKGPPPAPPAAQRVAEGGLLASIWAKATALRLVPWERSKAKIVPDS